MRRFLLVMVLGLVVTACSTPYGEFVDISKVPGVKPGGGDNNYNEQTTYKGALLPEYGIYGADGMLETLKLIERQTEEIDDAHFVELLEAKIFNCERRFMYIKDLDGEEPDQWSDATDWCGGQMLYDLAMYDDGTFAQCYHPSCAFVGEEYSYVHDLGHEGWSYRGVWHYDAENDMLYTSEDEAYAAKVLYFDGECAVLEGYVYPMWLYEDRDGQNLYSRETPMELYYFTFMDGKENYLDGYELTYEEFMAIIDEYHKKYMMFEGKEFPQGWAGAIQKMRECVSLLQLQQPDDIDDQAFVDMLSVKELSCEDRFLAYDELDYWVYGMYRDTEEFGEMSVGGDMIASQNGEYYAKISVWKDNEQYESLVAAGCYGWYNKGLWSYDPDSNTLTMTQGDRSYEAVLLYFDKESGEVVLRGDVGFVLDSDYDDALFRCKFHDKAPFGYLEGYLSYDEFVQLWSSL